MTANETVYRARRFLSTEADVIRASVLYLLHPVNVAVSQLIPQCGDIYCKSEMIPGAGCRTDVIWQYHCGQQSIKIAVLESKNTAILHYNDFAQAMASEQPPSP